MAAAGAASVEGIHVESALSEKGPSWLDYRPISCQIRNSTSNTLDDEATRAGFERLLLLCAGR
jgi:hypothetical protein